MLARLTLATLAIGASAAIAIETAPQAEAQSYQEWVEVPLDQPKQSMRQVAPEPVQQTGPNCGQLVARYNQITRERMSAARNFDARYADMTLSSRKLTGFCSAYENRLATLYDQVGEMNYLADTAAGVCPARVSQMIRSQADDSWGDYSSGSARLQQDCLYDEQYRQGG